MLNEQIVADNHALIARNRELERELVQLKAKLGAVVRIAERLHGEARDLAEMNGDKPIPRHVAVMRTVRHRIAEELREAVR